MDEINEIGETNEEKAKTKVISPEQLEDFKDDYQKKTKYTKKVWVAQKIMYIPAIVIFLGIFWMIFSGGSLFRRENMIFWLVNFVIAAAVLLLGIFILRSMSSAMAKKNKGRVMELPVYLGRIVVGNDEFCVYHSIFTTGDRKYDAEWLDALAQKIWDKKADEENPDAELDLLFSDKLMEVEPPEAQKLPPEITDGEEVYKKLIPFEKEHMKDVEAYGGFFPILYFDEKTVIPIYHTDL